MSTMACSAIDKPTQRSLPPFGQSSRRFDSQAELREIFDNSPGPGKYVGDAKGEDDSETLRKGPLFPKSLRPKHSSLSPGPAAYSIGDIKRNAKCAAVLKEDTKYNLPNSVFSNPTNINKPLIVSLFFKQETPGVGTYDVKMPYEITYDETCAPNSYKWVFESKD